MKMDEEEKTQGSINTGQDMKDFIEHSLYKTLSHVKSNNNFYFNIKNPFAETIVEEWPLFLLMGTVLSLQGIKIGGQECYKILIKTSYDNEIKAMVTRKSDYKDHLCRQFNRIMKNKN